MKQHTLFASASNTLEESLSAHIGRLPAAWRKALDQAGTDAALQKLSSFIDARLADKAEIYPRHPFRALESVQPDATQLVILGQDPYHGANQAQGLAFSVPNACRCPPSLRNIFKELALEYPEAARRQSHDLSAWARQGALLLNTSLTVESGQPASHANKGWEQVTDAILQQVADAPQAKVFLLWGAHAQSKQALLERSQGGPMLVLRCNHPSPLSARRPPVPFIGCGHFKKANEWLETHGQPGIDWFADE